MMVQNSVYFVLMVMSDKILAPYSIKMYLIALDEYLTTQAFLFAFESFCNSNVPNPLDL